MLWIHFRMLLYEKMMTGNKEEIENVCVPVHIVKVYVIT